MNGSYSKDKKNEIKKRFKYTIIFIHIFYKQTHDTHSIIILIIIKIVIYRIILLFSSTHSKYMNKIGNSQIQC